MKQLTIKSLQEVNALFFALDIQYDISRDMVSDVTTYPERCKMVDQVAGIAIGRHVVVSLLNRSNVQYPVRTTFDDKTYQAICDAVSIQHSVAVDMANDDPDFMKDKFETIVTLSHLDERLNSK